ncbi:MAG TPA: two-component regulator propeller domain-containing protein [Prolixibacteraceae bacterium]|nr:two-component regulator propeller domain-containing protein [Prolixibacteraceae bacterium]
MKALYLSLIFCAIVLSGGAQLRPGEWEYHLSMNQTFDLVEAGTKIFFLSEGGIYSYNKQDGSLEILNKIDRLSGADFRGISYNEATRSIVVSYQNSCIDVIRNDGSIFPIPDIKRKTMAGDKQIYNMTHQGSTVYLACGFGIVVLDLEKREVKDTYLIGENGNYLTVYDIALENDTLYAATRDGIKYASLQAPNLLDFSYWSVLENDNLPSVPYHFMVNGAGRLWTVHVGEEWWDDKTYTRIGASDWRRVWGEIGIINDFTVHGDKAIFCSQKESGGRVELFNIWTGAYQQVDRYSFADPNIPIDPRKAIIDSEGVLWVADKNYGGVRVSGNEYSCITPEGPADNNAYSLCWSDGSLFTAAGGQKSDWGNLYQKFQVGVLSDGAWENFNRFTQPVDPKYLDAIQALPVPGDPGHFFVATWGGGILEFESGTLKTIHNEYNSPLRSTIPGYYLRIGGLAFDSDHNLWVSNAGVENNLHRYHPADGTWESFYLPETSMNELFGKILVARNGDIWTIIPKTTSYGLYVMSPDGSRKKHLNVSSYFSNGEEELITPMNDVHSFAEDKDGAIWVGTSSGIAVYHRPENVFDEHPFYASQPGLDLNDGIYHPLLSTNTVTAIAVDGGNRKWCGTKNAGIFLISADGEDEIEHFTTENSNLISNTINDLAYNGENGTLYIATLQGMVAYRTDSKKSEAAFEKVYAYPNPVREGYEGDIYITGLMDDTNVKITTVSGRLVYETTSLGGQAVWNGKDLAGNKVHTGVYLALCASKDGEQSAITKILFIR